MALPTVKYCCQLVSFFFSVLYVFLDLPKSLTLLTFGMPRWSGFIFIFITWYIEATANTMAAISILSIPRKTKKRMIVDIPAIGMRKNQS